MKKRRNAVHRAGKPRENGCIEAFMPNSGYLVEGPTLNVVQ